MCWSTGSEREMGGESAGTVMEAALIAKSELTRKRKVPPLTNHGWPAPVLEGLDLSVSEAVLGSGKLPSSRENLKAAPSELVVTGSPLKLMRLRGGPGSFWFLLGASGPGLWRSSQNWRRLSGCAAVLSEPK